MSKIGLVLGGGGVKGWCHMGTIKAICELGIQLDYIGGTSSGAIAAACYAMTKDYEKTLAYFTQIMSTLRKPVKLRFMTWPTISLFTAKKGTRELQKVFTGTRIQDLVIPYFCISSNLSTLEENCHIQGLVWERVRASLSLPGLAPPMVLDNEMHLDGGLVNNLPVDRMRKLLGTNSKIIAVSVSGNKPDPKPAKPYKFPPIMTNHRLIKYYLGLKEYHFPKFSSLLIKSMLLGAAYKEIEMCREADYLISPNLQDYNMIGITEQEEQELMLIGYNQTKAALCEK